MTFDLSFLNLLGPDHEWFPRKAMAGSSGQVVVNCVKELLALFERYNFTDCFIQTHIDRDRVKGVIRLVFIDLDCPGDLDRARKLLDRVLHFLGVGYGIKPYVQFSGSKGYHIIIPIEPVCVGDKAKPFLKFLQQRLSKGYCDPQILGDLVRLVRFPDTINSKSGKLCETVQEWDGQRLDVSLLWEEFRLQQLIEEEEREKRQGSRSEPGFGFKPSHGIRPQIALLISRLKEGQNLTHQQRLAIVFELLARGWTEDQILELFRSSPDFNEERTRYMVEHAKARGYLPFKTKRLLEVVQG